MVDALAEPHTVAALIRSDGASAVIAQTAVLVTRSMEYFAPGRRMNPMQCNLLAETIAEKYPQETMADIALFIRMAALGEFEEGKSFGALDMGTMLRWWRMHLEEKAAQMEILAQRQEHELEHGMKRRLEGLVDGGLGAIVQAFSLEAKEKARAEGEIARIEKLRKHLPTMNLDELREAWKLYPLPTERALIQAQAARMGHLGEEHKAAQERIDQEAA